MAQLVKNPPAMWKTQVRSLGREDHLEKEMATHSSILAWKMPWMEEPGRYSPWGRKESDTTERLRFTRSLLVFWWYHIHFFLHDTCSLGLLCTPEEVNTSSCVYRLMLTSRFLLSNSRMMALFPIMVELGCSQSWSCCWVCSRICICRPVTRGLGSHALCLVLG